MTSRNSHEAGSNSSARTASAGAIFVEDTVEGTVVHVGDHALAFERDGAEPRVRDTDLARWLGYAQPRMIRKLIKRMILDGKLNNIAQRSTVERREGQVAAQSVTEFWLTRTQALLVATQSDTPKAWTLTEAIVSVFEAVVDGRHAGATAAQLTELSQSLLKLTEAQAENTKLVVRLVERVDALERRDHYPHGLISRERAQAILKELRDVAGLWYPDRKSREWKSCRARLEKDLRKAAGLAWRRWEDLEAHRDATVQLQLAELRAVAQRDPEARKRVEAWKNPGIFQN